MSKVTDDAKATEKPVELSAIHDFASKLRQPEMLPRLIEYVRWQADWRARRKDGVPIDDIEAIPDHASLSINLDLTTSCNYACDHCVDFEILNTKFRFTHEKLRDALGAMAQKGLKSVIVIGGGEPTLYPFFEDIIGYMKDLGLTLGIVTNGSMMTKILNVCDRLVQPDWVRLSLDSGSDEVFQKMHKPRKGVTLDQICAGVPPVKQANPAVNIGFSFIIVWQDCEANQAKIHENLDEIVMATERARKHQFDYISFKPFLTRAESNNAEVIDLIKEQRLQQVMVRIREQIDLAKQLETDRFRVIESTNLKVLENGTYADYTQQPKTCHMTFFRQVVSPLGLFNCPVYRHVPAGRLGSLHAYSDPQSMKATQRSTLANIESFDASTSCRDVTCLYNHVNWFIEDLIAHPDKLDSLAAAPDRQDWFL